MQVVFVPWGVGNRIPGHLKTRARVAAAVPPRALFPTTLFVLLSGSAVFFAGSVAAPAVLERVGGGPLAGGMMTAAVQVGFVAGTMVTVAFDLPDRVAPRRLLAVFLLGGAAANALLLSASSVPAALLWRFLAGALAGPVYPVGMRLLATWYKRLGTRLGILLGAYTLGVGLAALLRSLQAPFAAAVWIASAAAIVAAAASLALRPGPHLPARQSLDPRALLRSYRVPAYRWSSLAYFGHMWELFAFWGLLPFWIAAAGWTGTAAQGVLAGTFVAGAAGCLWAGFRCARVGEGRVARTALGVSGLACLASPWLFAAPPWLFVAGLWLWGWMVIADSPMFSALSARAAPPEYVGSALTVQNSIGFAVPILPLLLIPALAVHVGWQWAFMALALGPVLGWPLTWRLARAGV